MANIVNPAELQDYLRKTRDFKLVVRPARDFIEAVQQEFYPEREHRHPEMFSTKLRGRIAFRPGEVTVWAGYSGHRKSTFVGQLVSDLCVQKQRVLVMSMEMRPEQTLARMARQMSASQRPSRDWLDKFSDWTDGFLWILDYQGRIDPELCLAAMSWFVDKGACQPHVVIDSMMMVVKSEEHLDQQKQFTTDIVRWAQETWAHIHLVAHCRKKEDDSKPPNKYDLKGTSAITDQAANVVTIWVNKAKQHKSETDYDVALDKQPDAAVTVEKQRNGEFEGRLSMWFDPLTMRFVDDPLRPVEPYVMER